MSVKFIDLVSSKKRNENVQKKILQRQNEAQRPLVFPKPETPLLSDKSEFPSLSESLGKVLNCVSSSEVSLKYSDKLKSPSSSRNQVSVSGNVFLKCDTEVPCTSQNNETSRSNFQRSVKLGDNSRQSVSKRVSNYFLNKSVSSSNKISNIEKNALTKQKPVLKSKLNIQNTAGSSDAASISAKSSNHSNKSVTVENNESKEINGATQSTSKKKKRKSKIKRQVALQSGKITFLTPEVHSKILNQTSTVNAQNSIKITVIGNINDEEEYPELGKVSQKENFQKRSISSECHGEATDKPIDYSIGQNAISKNINKESPVHIASEKEVMEKKDKNEKVHSLNPITISFYDMLLEKNIKKKEVKEVKIKDETPNVIGISKLKTKKNANYPHNLLDSSSPAVKRGKEREKPKPKKPSQLKKIILLDRKIRRENLLQMKNNYGEKILTNENELLSEPHAEGNNQGTSENKDECENLFMDELPELCEEREESIETVLQLTETTDAYVQDELIAKVVHLNIISDDINNHNIIDDVSPDIGKAFESYSFPEKSSSNLTSNEKTKSEEDNNTVSQINNESEEDSNTVSQINNESVEDSKAASQINSQSDSVREIHLNVPHSPESLLNTLITDETFDTADKERAVKILLHTRNFREYCNHLISKDIDDVTFALLDDLARFQDRLHQKDPVKARMKKRLVYGVKEVKKHIRLRKLKCIIIAVDIENVETQGGLNDILNEIKISAVDHHIPCIFSLSRKILGKVCRKPVPVSCVGVFNYEGSEANFKRVVELQSQGKTDYAEIFNKLLIKITDEDVATLIKAKKEAPETLRDVRANILSNFFQLAESVKGEDGENIDLKSNEDFQEESNKDVSNLFDISI